MIETEKAWLAGIVDGEGSIGLYKIPSKIACRGFSWKSLLVITNTNQDLLHKVLKLIPGDLQKQPKVENHKQGYNIILYPSAIRKILPQILPYLVAKKPQAMLLLRALDLVSEHAPGRTPNDTILEEIWSNLRILNKRGC